MLIDDSQGLSIEQIDVTDIDENEWNPNVMDDKEFNKLVEDMSTVGFLQPLLVVESEDGRYRVIDGAHRLLGAQLSGMQTVPCVVARGDYFQDEDKQKFHTMRMNMLRGKLDKRKFKAFVEDLATRYSLADLSEYMAYEDVDHLREMVEGARKDLPKELRPEFDKAREEIKTVEDLSDVLNRLFTKFGSTLPYNFMILDFGGKDHLWIRFTGRKEYKTAQGVSRKAQARGVTLDSVMRVLFNQVDDAFFDEHAEHLDAVEEDQ